MATPNNNWAGNLRYRAAERLAPRSLNDLQEAVAAASLAKGLGSRHSFNEIADTEGTHISTEHLISIPQINVEDGTVEIQSGVRYGELSQYLHLHGYSLGNLASLPHISVAGACATATHGSGVTNACLADAVCDLEMVTAEGTLQRFTDRQSEFFGTVVSLGGMGVVARMKLRILPTFQVRQSVFEGLPLETFFHNFDEAMGKSYSVSFFTTWQTGAIDQVWVKAKADEPDMSEFFGALPAPEDRHPILCLSAENCTPQMGVAGAWHERLPHFRMGFTPSSGAELQSEYLVPRENAVQALREVNTLREHIAPCLQISEIRSIAEDRHWMSPFYNQPCIGIHFTWQRDWPAVSKVLPLIEEELVPLGARPHWAKLSTMKPVEIRAQFPRFNDFKDLMVELDPDGKFRNAWLDQLMTG